MSKKPNVILIFVDDLGYGDVSSFNKDSKIHTKNIDALAMSGMCFTDSHASAPLCTPSRYSLLTGRYNFRSRLKRNVLAGDSSILIEKDRKTLGHLFQENGYSTACVGKWHLGMEWHLKDNYGPHDYPEIDPKHYDTIPKKTPFVSIPGEFDDRIEGLDIDYTKPIIFGPNEHGFDYYFGMVASMDQPPYVYIENHDLLKPLTKWSGTLDIERKNPGDTDKWQFGLSCDDFDHSKIMADMNNKVLELIDDYAQEDRPFFIYYPTPAVHTPFYTREEFKGKSEIGPYGDMVLELDFMVGEITAKLREKNILDDTIIIFTSDNGCSSVVDFEEMIKKGHNPSYHFRGDKGMMYEGGHRVPTIIHYPSKIRAGSICEENVCHTDFYRTFADMFSNTLPDEVAEDSFSMLPLIYETGKSDRAATICNSAVGFMGIIKNGYKLLCCPDGGVGRTCVQSVLEGKTINEPFELFNLNDDIQETTDIFSKNPKIVDELLKELNRVFDDGRSYPGTPQQNIIPEKEWTQINFKK